jgi:hypothetical protein
LRQLSLFCHTGDIEVFNSMMLKYVPKRQEFQYPKMVARTQLANVKHVLLLILIYLVLELWLYILEVVSSSLGVV